MNKTFRSPIVGMHFRPPAQAILDCLAGGATLRLEPEPENPYDPDAIRVMVQATPNLKPSQLLELEEILPSYGWTLEMLESTPWLQLGYCASAKNVKAHSYGTVGCAELGQALAPAWVEEEVMADEPFARSYPGKLAFDAAGRPLVKVELS